jgi:hypothetical protein
VNPAVDRHEVEAGRYGRIPGLRSDSGSRIVVGAPFLAAFVVDSDFAEVRCAAPGLPDLRFVLKPLHAADYDCPVDPQAQETAVPYLLRWAGEGADEAVLRAALQGSLTFAEDSVLHLAAGIGAIPSSELEDVMFGSLEQNGA